MVNNTEHKPASASANGWENRYYVACPAIGQYKAYAACLSIIDRQREGTLSEVYGECDRAVSRGVCPALLMRQTELESGRAIYFTARIGELVPKVVEKVVKWFNPAKTKSSELTSKSPVTRFDTGSYADALNAPRPVAPAMKLEAIPGESPLMMARRLMSQNQKEQQ